MSDRLFFALWPDPDLRQALRTRLDRIAPLNEGNSSVPTQWHVTLEFLGQPGRTASVRCRPPRTVCTVLRSRIDVHRVEHGAER